MEITKSQFKSQFESILEKLGQKEGDEEIIIVDNGEPLFKVSRYQKRQGTAELFASLRGKVKYYEDLTTPTTEEWGEV
ncbi:type II toxin-antitoxin system Phd/YefM family antitoxin [Picosynechococcus sp. PCC 7117]|uniref:type II toxin-antitoxin system Phd/YefM family antitoxin n=1 Tax=Picosynechococcus sp. PCC 7117 TaxID=195498 RepID=UPI0008109E27|nr:prevent-host-death protein [Picosynechococcus sp. PCC 7117]ANV89069.1 prevent-host-death protein [Picosynechococcus sp. PCC 7117]